MSTDQSNQTDGDAASSAMNAGIVSEFHNRLLALESDNKNLQAQLASSRQSGDVPYPGFVEHLSHVMQKHFFHDKPDGFEEKYGERSASERAAG